MTTSALAAARAPRLGEADRASRIAAIEQLLARFDRSDAPGLVLGIAEHGQPVLRRGVGMASVQHGAANSPATRMRIASTSKHFTALAALLLAEEGRLDLDAPADRYLPGLSTPLGRPTLRHFITHTSGLRCTLELGTLANGYAAQPAGWQMDALMRQRGAHFAPGHGQLYCNGTYHALSHVIEQVAGMPFERFLQERIFQPIGMRDTESIRNDHLMVPGMASPHVPAAEGGWQRPPSDSELRGDGGMVSTVDDMLRWLAHLRGEKKIGNAATWEQLLGPATLCNGLQTVYAMGLKRHRFRGVEVIHHSGGLLGLNCQMLTVPSLGLDVIVMVNGAAVSATGLVRDVLEAWVGAAHLSPPPHQVRSAECAALVGKRYRSPDGLLIGFDDVDGALGLSFMNMHAVPVLFHVGDEAVAGFEDIGMGPFSFAMKDLSCAGPNPPRRLPIRICGDAGSLELLNSSDTGEPQPPIACGCFHSPDLQADAQIVGNTGSDLVLHLRGDYSAWRSFRMTPFSSTVFGLVGIDEPSERYVLTLDAREDGGFVLDTYRARGVGFDRVATR